MRAVESLKICTLVDFFFSNVYKDFDEKVVRRVMSHINEECAKFEEKLNFGSKNDMGNLVNFNVSSGKSESLHFGVLLFSIAYKVSDKKEQKNYHS